MTNFNHYSLRDETEKSVGASCNLYQQILTVKYRPHITAGTFNIHIGIITDSRQFINACLINPASGYTRSEEIANAGGIGGRLPSDYAPAYEKAVKKCKWILSHNPTIEICTKSNSATAWLVSKEKRVEIRFFKEILKWKIY